jgi:hypothetical protein
MTMLPAASVAIEEGTSYSFSREAAEIICVPVWFSLAINGGWETFVGAGKPGAAPVPATMTRREAAQLHPAIAIYRIDEEPSACILYFNLSRFRS